MKKMNRINRMIAFVLVGALFFTQVGIISYADIINDSPSDSEENESLTLDEAEVYKQEIRNYREEVNNLKLERDTDYKMVNEFNNKALEISENIDNTAQKMSLAGIGSIYDLSSIPQRLVMVGKIGRAIRFATTQLRYKVDEAHAEIAEYVFAGLVIAASPFHTVEDMKAYMAEFEVLKAKLLTYPDMQLNDTANIYVRADLDAKLHKARFMKYNELKDKPSYVIDSLAKEVREITLARLRPQATVAEIYQLSDRLDQAVAEALNNEDEIALKSEKNRLKELVRELYKAKRKIKDPAYGAAYDRAKEELRELRPSKMKVNGLIETIENLLY